ncbi:hypothetical protein H8891_06285 [Paeniclostridium sp. NSJ-45]|uniref:ABC transporter permease n=1 Tax=Paeniclostridium hominis TaxID=2764329 RepID=A0ABR7K2S8_9FIRM|nr:MULTISPECIES: hypothetical protein [Paeniclostridium]MBC6003403.1 hypothetical protein [Paeniclostridium hominis]
MLRKLLKYELRATAKVLVPMYISILGMCIINSIFISSEISLSNKKIFGIVTMALLVALITLTIVICIQRFKKNLLEDEGYLMFTLPLSSTKLILSKYISAVLWIMGTIIVTLISYSLFMIQQATSIGMIYGSGITFYIGDKMISFQELTRTNKDLIVIILSILLLISIVSIIIFIVYNSIAISQLSIFAKYKNISSILIFITISSLVTILNTINNNIGLKPDISNLEFMGAFIKVMTLGILQNIFLIIILFLILNYTLNKKLNLN